MTPHDAALIRLIERLTAKIDRYFPPDPLTVEEARNVLCYKLAYAVSIHKSQGSEYPAVVIPILTQHYILLQRNLLYTGVTRGKKLVVIIGTKKAMAIAIRNNKTEERYTLLSERLRG